jgi:RNA polymerase sigma-70 factor (ECF subfamily)
MQTDQSTLGGESDEALVARLAKQDKAALGELHRRYAALVFAVTARIAGSVAAEDIVQDVFVTLWTKHASFDPARGPLKPWLVQVTRRHALNALRALKRSETRDPDLLDQIEVDSILPDEAGWLAHRREVIRAAVDALPEAQRQALSLAFFDELTHEQIAKVLGTPLGSAKTRIRTALKRLAPVLLATLVVVAAVILMRRRDEQAARTEDALRMVTASDTVSVRLTPTPMAPVEAHGTYRTRPGATVAVLTTSYLPPLAGTETYVAWARDGSAWRRLGPVRVEGDGRSLLVVEVRSGAETPLELRVTRESSATGSAPSGPALLEWNAQR